MIRRSLDFVILKESYEMCTYTVFKITGFYLFTKLNLITISIKILILDHSII